MEINTQRQAELNYRSSFKRSKDNRCKQLLVKLDLQGRNFNFYLPDGNLTYKTSSGGLCCLVLVFSWLVYATSLSISLLQRQNYNLLEKTYED